ncbi:MAG: flagellar biosynthesis regulator FlaF [Rhodospirillaceae bacterium]
MCPSNEPAPEGAELNKTKDPDQVEVFALREIALRLKAAQENPENEDNMLQVVRLNWRLWTIFQTSLLDADCRLPIFIRNNILSLSNFVDRHSADIIAVPAASKLDVLIRLNHDLADGLSGAASSG